jgi:heparosan-N-sulfate-glucuronate 5-epimerase
MGRLSYLQRIFSAYLTGRKSHLTFWHGEPQVNEHFEPGKLGEYYMPFTAKAKYSGHYDNNGIPMLDYRGALGLQYNPIAISQYGLGNYNLCCRSGEPSCRSKFLKTADWLVEHFEATPYGTGVWYHHFDWEYRDTLRAPWHSALAQGQGISLLVRAHKETGDDRYLAAATEAFHSFEKDVRDGGVTYTDDEGYVWLEEYIVFPPTHILNGFIWASWGVYDYFLATGEAQAHNLFNQCIRTLLANLYRYDMGFWSLYEQSGTRLKMIASPFYHHLHIIQLLILYRLTGEVLFHRYAMRWEKYRRDPIKRSVALLYKALFKAFYY